MIVLPWYINVCSTCIHPSFMREDCTLTELYEASFVEVHEQ